MRVLVTGASGLVGHETVVALRRAGAEEVVGVSRAGSAAKAGAVAWEMAAEEPPAALRGPWDAIVHTAADTRWTLAPAEATRANADVVRALAPLAGLETHVVHVSTAYSLGLRGSVSSDRLEDYRNSYEWSKAHSERLVRSGFPRHTVVRPPLIIGRRGDGEAARFTGMYTLLRAITASMVPVVVAEADAFLEVVPVDDVAAVVVEAAMGGGGGETLTVAGGRGAPSVEEVFEAMTAALNEWRRERDLEPFDVPRLITRDSWERFFLPFVRDQLSGRQEKILALLSNFEPYLAIEEPLQPTHRVEDVLPAIGAAVRYWADAEPGRAATMPRPWKAVAQ